MSIPTIAKNVQSTPHQTQQREFREVAGSPERFKQLQSAFQDVLEPLYGSQKDALEKIQKAVDRTAFLLYEGDSPVGVLVYKNNASDEYSQYGVTDSVEIKSLFVLDAGNNSNKGIGSRLLDQVTKAARTFNATSLHVTVSSEKEESLQFFKKKSFKVQASFPDKYKKGVTEYLLSLPLHKEEQADKPRKIAVIKRPSSSPEACSSLSTQSQKSDGFEIRRINGKKERLDAVEQLFNKNFASIHGPNKDYEFDKLKKGQYRDARLLFVNDILAGAVTYRTDTSDYFTKYGVRNTFEITGLLYDKQQTKEATQKVAAELLEKALEKAQDAQADSISIVINSGCDSLVEFLVSRNFAKVEGFTEKAQELFTLRLREKEKRDQKNLKAETQAAFSSAQPFQPRRLDVPSAATQTRKTDERWQQNDRRGDGRAQGMRSGPSQPAQLGSRERPHTTTLMKKYIHLIQTGKKTVEGRISSGMFMKFKEGDFAKFFYNQNPHDGALCKVLKVTKYPSFRVMLEKEGVEACLPGVKSLDAGVREYDAIPGYNQRAAQSGVLGLKLQFISKE